MTDELTPQHVRIAALHDAVNFLTWRKASLAAESIRLPDVADVAKRFERYITSGVMPLTEMWDE